MQRDNVIMIIILIFVISIIKDANKTKKNCKYQYV